MFTATRILLANYPDPPEEGAVETTCPYCDRPVWQRPLEQLPEVLAAMPPNTVYACADCALRRATHQAEMDADLARKRALRN